MSGPCCYECKWFYQPPLSDKDLGECTDPTKRIYYKYGDAANGPPVALTTNTCMNWAAQSRTEGEKKA